MRSTAASVPSPEQCFGFDFFLLQHALHSLESLLSRSFTVTVWNNHNSKLYLYLDILFVEQTRLNEYHSREKRRKDYVNVWCKNALIRCDRIHANNK